MGFWAHAGRALSFLLVQYTLGRRGSYPYGLWMGYSLTVVSLLVFCSDLIQIMVLLRGLDSLRPWWGRMRQHLPVRRWRRPAEGRMPSRRWAQWGAWGVFLVSALPYAGGALSGSLVAVSIRLKQSRAFWVISAGCLMGTLLFHLGFSGVIRAVKAF